MFILSCPRLLYSVEEKQGVDNASPSETAQKHCVDFPVSTEVTLMKPAVAKSTSSPKIVRLEPTPIVWG